MWRQWMRPEDFEQAWEEVSPWGFEEAEMERIEDELREDLVRRREKQHRAEVEMKILQEIEKLPPDAQSEILQLLGQKYPNSIIYEPASELGEGEVALNFSGYDIDLVYGDVISYVITRRLLDRIDKDLSSVSGGPRDEIFRIIQTMIPAVADNEMVFTKEQARKVERWLNDYEQKLKSLMEEYGTLTKKKKGFFQNYVKQIFPHARVMGVALFNRLTSEQIEALRAWIRDELPGVTAAPEIFTDLPYEEQKLRVGRVRGNIDAAIEELKDELKKMAGKVVERRGQRRGPVGAKEEEEYQTSLRERQSYELKPEELARQMLRELRERGEALSSDSDESDTLSSSEDEDEESRSKRLEREQRAKRARELAEAELKRIPPAPGPPPPRPPAEPPRAPLKQKQKRRKAAPAPERRSDEEEMQRKQIKPRPPIRRPEAAPGPRILTEEERKARETAKAKVITRVLSKVRAAGRIQELKQFLAIFNPVYEAELNNPTKKYLDTWNALTDTWLKQQGL